jgi:hypothetical protein
MMFILSSAPARVFTLVIRYAFGRLASGWISVPYYATSTYIFSIQSAKQFEVDRACTCHADIRIML